MLEKFVLNDKELFYVRIQVKLIEQILFIRKKNSTNIVLFKSLRNCKRRNKEYSCNVII